MRLYITITNTITWLSITIIYYYYPMSDIWYYTTIDYNR